MNIESNETSKIAKHLKTVYSKQQKLLRKRGKTNKIKLGKKYIRKEEKK
jgi:hypothetical protein